MDFAEVRRVIVSNEVKAPQDVVLDLPQERVTGDVLRGYGPRRGNLERLLRYWRPIMRKPGGFRRCRVILANHPELYPLERICAWLHHETTGLWPNEGCHHPGMKNCRKKIRGVVRGSLITNDQFESRMRKLRRGGSRAARKMANISHRTSADQLKYAMAALARFAENEKEFCDFLRDEKNWVHQVQDMEGNWNETAEESATKDCCSGVIRTVLVAPDPSRNILLQPIGTNEAAVRAKTIFHVVRNRTQSKVGVIGSTSRVGQTLQGAGTFLLPGDLSNIRRPVRSRGWAAVTPGGNNLRRPRVPGPGKTRGFRCPEGFRYGGRFTDARYSTCGQMLFDRAILGRTLGQRSGRKAESEASELTPEMLQRALQIPKVQRENIKERDDSRRKAVQLLRSGKSGDSIIVRRDGYALRPVVSVDELRNVPDNRNMAEATFLMSASKPADLGGNELGLLSNTVITSIWYVLPDGVVLKLERVKDLTVGQRRKIGRAISGIKKIDVTTDRAARLKAFADESGGGIEYSEGKGASKGDAG